MNVKVKNAIFISSLCSTSYLAVYIARNILSAVTPQMLENSNFTTEYIGSLSSLFFITYAIGQLFNGIVGEKIKARYMISFGLLLAGMCYALYPQFVSTPTVARIVYGLSGVFLAMIYAPMTKVIAENTDPIYTTRCLLGNTFASFFGSPLAGIMAILFAWGMAFRMGGFLLIFMGLLCFLLFLLMERKGIVKYNQYTYKKEKHRDAGIKILVKHRIIKFTLISFLTGIVRTSVVFWMPTFISQYLGFSSEKAITIFTVATFGISMTAFVAVFLYERLHRNMDLTILIAFISATICFCLVFIIKVPIISILFFVLAIMSSNCADSMMWSRYCPSLRDTGMVSTATGFLDFVSYSSAAIANLVFANAVSIIGWGNLILIWFGLMILGVVIALPYRIKR